MDTECLNLFSDEELIFSDDSEERVNEVSPLTVQDTLLDVVNSFESYDGYDAYDTLCNNEENINIDMFDNDPFGLHWPNSSDCIVDTGLETAWKKYKYEHLPVINMDSSVTNTIELNIINPPSQLVFEEEEEEEEQKRVDIEEETASKIIDNNKMMKVKTECEDYNNIKNIEQEVKEKEFKCPSSNTLPVLSREINKRNANIRKKSQNAKGRKKKDEDSTTIINEKVKLEEQEDCVDIETISKDEVPVLEAADVKSLLEQFEASENPNPCNKLTVKYNRTYDTRSNKPCQVTQECRASVSQKSVLQASTQQKDVHTSLSKDVIDKIKASGRKKSIPIIPAMPNIQGGNRNNSVRIQNGAPRNKIVKINSTITNNAKSRAVNSALVQLDHDYCSSANLQTKSYNSNKTTKHMSILKSSQNKKNCMLEERQNDVTQYNTKSVNICNVRVKPWKPVVLQDKIEDNLRRQLLENNEDCQKETPLKQCCDSSNSSFNKSINSNESSTIPFETIRSSLAKKILKSKGILPKTNIAQTNLKPQHMISVLKNPPNASQFPFSTNSLNENIVTTTNSLNNEVQNIIVQNTQNTLPHKEMTTNPPRKKLNLAEYLTRRNKSKVLPKKQSPMILVYVYNAATKTEIVNDDPNNPEIWCEREIISVLKDRSQIKEEKNRPKPLTCEAEVQTHETMFELSTNTVVDVEEDERSLSRSKSRSKSKSPAKQECCKKFSRSSNRSRSKSKSRSRSRSRSRDRRRSRSHSKNKSRSRSNSRSRTRNRNINTHSRSTTRSRSRNRSRSKSRQRSNTRRRTISHRRSSVSSNSSWSSHSRWSSRSTRSRYSYSSSSSRSHYRSRSHSRSRSHTRSRSRNRSRSRIQSRSSSRSRSSRRHYSSRSSYRSPSNFGRNRWYNHRPRDCSDRERNYDKYGRHSFTNRHDYRSCSRSPLRSYHKPYDNWNNKEKQREVEERRVIYVGRLNKGITETDLLKRFEVFGPVVDISVHLRGHSDNYGFVTFLYNTDAYAAVEHGNDNPSLPKYDLSFGGRRAFCKDKYADLDDMKNNTPISRSPQASEETFDYLLKEAQAHLRKRKV